MEITLTGESQRLVQDEVASGRFSAPGEVVEEALRLFKECEQWRRIRLEELRREIAIGLDQLDRGEVVDGRAFVAELRSELERRARASRQG